MRLQKYLARSGVASRRGSENLMTAGRVAVNGEIVTELGSKVDPERDVVTVDGREVSLATGPTYYVLNKPAGYVTTMDDPHGRRTVAELLPAGAAAGMFPVGRLDQDTTGLLLLSTDGDLAYRLMHPKFHVPKTYIAEVEGRMSEEAADRLRAGIMLDDGPTKPADVRILQARRLRSKVEVVLSEGRKRQVRRMLYEVGHPVTSLSRVAFGPVLLGDLVPGGTRELTAEELAALREASGIDETGSAGSVPPCLGCSGDDENSEADE